MDATIAFLVFGVLVVLLLIGVPIAFAIGGAVMSVVLYWDKISLTFNFQQMYNGVDSFTLLALPLFMWMGSLMDEAGLIDDLLLVCRVCCGRIRGSLAQANILGSMVFAGISGSATADTAAIGGTLIPAMIKEGYDPDFSVAVTASSSVIGPIIPPSIGMVLYGSIMGVSVSALFFGGMVPGIQLGVGLMIVTAYYSHKRKYPKEERRYSPKEIVHAFARTLPAIIMMVILLGGLLTGVCTPTEISGIAVVYVLLVGVLYYRSLTPKVILRTLLDSMAMAGGVLAITSISTPLGRIVALANIPAMLGGLISSIAPNRFVVLLLINLFMLFMGMIMESNANLLIFAPIFAPIAISFGVNPVHFGVMFVLNVIIGLATPPFGVCMFMAADIAKIPIERAMKAMMPFVGVEILVLMLVTYFEPLVTFVPKLFGLM